jgi:hypothetical protein
MRIPKITPAQIKAMTDADLSNKLAELEGISSNSEDGELKHSANGYAQLLAAAQVKRATAKLKRAKVELAAFEAIAL